MRSAAIAQGFAVAAASAKRRERARFRHGRHRETPRSRKVPRREASQRLAPRPGLPVRAPRCAAPTAVTEPGPGLVPRCVAARGPAGPGVGRERRRARIPVFEVARNRFRAGSERTLRESRSPAAPSTGRRWRRRRRRLTRSSKDQATDVRLGGAAGVRLGGPSLTGGPHGYRR